MVFQTLFVNRGQHLTLTKKTSHWNMAYCFKKVLYLCRFSSTEFWTSSTPSLELHCGFLIFHILWIVVYSKLKTASNDLSTAQCGGFISVFTTYLLYSTRNWLPHCPPECWFMLPRLQQISKKGRLCSDKFSSFFLWLIMVKCSIFIPTATWFNKPIQNGKSDVNCTELTIDQLDYWSSILPQQWWHMYDS